MARLPTTLRGTGRAKRVETKLPAVTGPLDPLPQTLDRVSAALDASAAQLRRDEDRARREAEKSDREERIRQAYTLGFNNGSITTFATNYPVTPEELAAYERGRSMYVASKLEDITEDLEEMSISDKILSASSLQDEKDLEVSTAIWDSAKQDLGRIFTQLQSEDPSVYQEVKDTWLNIRTILEQTDMGRWGVDTPNLISSGDALIVEGNKKFGLSDDTRADQFYQRGLSGANMGEGNFTQEDYANYRAGRTQFNFDVTNVPIDTQNIINDAETLNELLPYLNDADTSKEAEGKRNLATAKALQIFEVGMQVLSNDDPTAEQLAEGLKEITEGIQGVKNPTAKTRLLEQFNATSNTISNQVAKLVIDETTAVSNDIATKTISGQVPPEDKGVYTDALRNFARGGNVTPAGQKLATTALLLDEATGTIPQLITSIPDNPDVVSLLTSTPYHQGIVQSKADELRAQGFVVDSDIISQVEARYKERLGAVIISGGHLGTLERHDVLTIRDALGLNLAQTLRVGAYGTGDAQTALSEKDYDALVAINENIELNHRYPFRENFNISLAKAAGTRAPATEVIDLKQVFSVDSDDKAQAHAAKLLGTLADADDIIIPANDMGELLNGFNTMYEYSGAANFSLRTTYEAYKKLTATSVGTGGTEVRIGYPSAGWPVVAIEMFATSDPLLSDAISDSDVSLHILNTMAGNDRIFAYNSKTEEYAPLDSIVSNLPNDVKGDLFLISHLVTDIQNLGVFGGKEGRYTIYPHPTSDKSTNKKIVSKMERLKYYLDRHPNLKAMMADSKYGNFVDAIDNEWVVSKEPWRVF